MHRSRILSLARGLAGLALLAVAGIPRTLAAPVNVDIAFAAEVGDQAFACGRSYADIGTTHSKITPTDFRFYVSDVQLLRADGRAVPLVLQQDGLWQYRDVALLDFEDGSGPCRNGNAATNRSVRGTVPAGRYRGLRFTLGVPFPLNHADPTVAPSPLNLTALFWVWNVGYKFVKIDMSTSGQPDAGLDAARPPDPKERAVGFPVHIGSTGCASASKTTPPQAPCKAPNRVVVTLDHFAATHDVVIADLAALLHDADVDRNTPNTAPGCMSEPDDPDCVPIFEALGLGTSPQRFFRVGRRSDL